MARTFENPANRHRETVDIGSSFGAFFLGLIYLVFKGLWSHAFVWFLVVALPALGGGGVLAVFTVPLLSIGYAIAIQGILARRYLDKGWQEVLFYDPSAPETMPAAPGSQGSSATTTEGMKLCPYCSEEVKVAAVKCKHCQSSLPIVDSPVETGDKRITVYNKMYMVGGYHFDTLAEAQQFLAERSST